jgi:hypothetical protein
MKRNAIDNNFYKYNIIIKTVIIFIIKANVCITGIPVIFYKCKTKIRYTQCGFS